MKNSRQSQKHILIMVQIIKYCFDKQKQSMIKIHVI